MKMRALSLKARRASLWREISPVSEQRLSFSFTTRRTIAFGSSSASATTFGVREDSIPSPFSSPRLGAELKGHRFLFPPKDLLFRISERLSR